MQRPMLRIHTWITTSEESTTLYSSPQMRLDWPLSKPFSRVPFFSPSKTSSTSSLCFSTYLSNHDRGFKLATDAAPRPQPLRTAAARCRHSGIKHTGLTWHCDVRHAPAGPSTSRQRGAAASASAWRQRSAQKAASGPGWRARPCRPACSPGPPAGPWAASSRAAAPCMRCRPMSTRRNVYVW